MESWETVKPSHLRQRLLHDLKELQDKPYPGITLRTNDNLTQACLVLQPEGEPALHLTLHLSPRFPIEPPYVTIQSTVSHPNVFGDFICISLLECKEGYTPAYTLKGICIQLLSFFSSENVEQMWGEHGGIVNRKAWKTEDHGYQVSENYFRCRKCDFGFRVDEKEDMQIEQSQDANASGSAAMDLEPRADVEQERENRLQLAAMPRDIFLMICDHLDEESLLLTAQASEAFSRTMQYYNVLRTRELQCFTFKQGFKEQNLGVGVHYQHTPIRQIQSEFELISYVAFKDYGVRSSTQGLPFELWLPLPISEMHWRRVRKYADTSLTAIGRKAGVSGTVDKVLYQFLNEIVVRLSQDAEDIEKRMDHFKPQTGSDGSAAPKSSLTHASEKAIESYFHLFHLLVVLADENKHIAREACNVIQNFLNGNHDKQKVPNIGFLLIAITISDVEISEQLTKDIVEETITRSVVWMLEAPPKGKGFPELSYMEPSAISQYRLQNTFNAGKTGYRLLMIQNTIRRMVSKSCTTADKDSGENRRMTLEGLRKNLFARHGAPPEGAAAEIAEEVRKIQKVDGFLGFLEMMGLPRYGAASFTALLRRCVAKSMDQKGYSRWALTQDQALQLRLSKEPEVERRIGLVPQEVHSPIPSFFPDKRTQGGERGGRGSGRSGHGGRGRRGGRGRGRGG